MRVRHVAAVVAAVLVPAVLASPASAATSCNYTGPSGGSWHAVGNWSCPGGPTAADAVVLDSGDNVVVTAFDASAASLSIASGATLGFANAHKLDVSGATTIASGTVTGAGRLNANGGLTKSGTDQLFVSGGVTVTFGVDSTWSAGDICITGGSTLRVSVLLSIAAGAGSFNCSSNDSFVQVTATGTIDIAGGTRTWFAQVDNDGTVNLDAGALSLAAPSPNSDAGAWSIAAPATLTLANSHALGASGALGGAGTLIVSAGTTTVPDGGTLNPAILTVPGGILNVDGAGTLSLPTVNLTGGTLGGTRTRTIGSLSAQSGTLTGAQTTTITGSLVKSTAGQVSISGGTTVRPTVDTSWSGGDICIQGGSVFRIQNELDIAATAGSFNCSSNDSLVQVTATGVIDIAGGTRTWFARVDNDGQIQLDTGALSLAAASANSDAGAWAIAAPATLTLASDHGLAAGSTIGGAGTLIVSAGTTTVPDGGTLNPNVLTLTGGELTVNGAGTLSLPTVNLTGGTLGGTRTRTIGSLSAQSGTLTGAQTTTITGSLVKSTAGQVSISGGTTLRPEIDSTWTGGNICIQGGSVLRIQNRLDIAAGAGSFNCSSNDSLVQVTPTALIDIAGGTRTWFARVDNDGQIQLDTGALSLAAASANSDAGAWAIAAPATLTLASDHGLAAGATIGGPGTLVLTSGTTTVPDGATLNPNVLTLTGGELTVNGAGTLSLPTVNLTGGTLGGTRTRTIGSLAAQSGTLTGAQTTTVTGSFVKSTAGQVSISGGTTLRPEIDSTWNGGDICIQGGSVLRIQNELDIAATAGSFNCSSNDSLVQVTPTALIDIAGGTRTWFARVDNDGQIQLDTGALTLAAASANTDAGAWAIAAPATLTLASDHGLAAGATIGGPGTLVLTSGTTTAPNGATLNPNVLTLTGGELTVDGAGTLSLPTVNLTGGTLGGTRTRTIGSLTAQSGTLTGAQTTTVTGSFVKSTAGQVTFNGGITLHASADVSWNAGDICIQSGSTFEVGHALHVTAGAGQFNCSSADSLVDVLASGSVDVSPGPARTWFTRVRNAGDFTLAADRSLSFAAGFTNTGGVFTVNGTAGGAVAITGGALAGSGTLTGNVANTGGTVKPAGRLSITGNYAQSAAATLETDLAAAGFDQLAVGGVASLDGTLSLVRDPAFNPRSGTKFLVLPATARTGTFATLTGTTFGAKSFADDGTKPSFELVVTGPDAPDPATPTISGTVAIGSTLTCNEGVWGGSPTFKYEWLRDGKAAGDGRTYTIAPADAGHQLACVVIGTNAGGSVESKSAPVTVPTPTPTPLPTVSPTPTPTVTPPPLTGASPSQIATAFGLPSANHCTGRRDFTIRLREPKGIKIKNAEARVDGKRVQVKKTHGVWVAQFDLPRVHKSSFTLTIRITTADKRTLNGKRVYKVCAKR